MTAALGVPAAGHRRSCRWCCGLFIDAIRNVSDVWLLVHKSLERLRKCRHFQKARWKWYVWDKQNTIMNYLLLIDHDNWMFFFYTIHGIRLAQIPLYLCNSDLFVLLFTAATLKTVTTVTQTHSYSITTRWSVSLDLAKPKRDDPTRCHRWRYSWADGASVWVCQTTEDYLQTCEWRSYRKYQGDQPHDAWCFLSDAPAIQRKEWLVEGAYVRRLNLHITR